MQTKSIAITIVVVIVLIGGYFLFRGGSPSYQTPQPTMQPVTPPTSAPAATAPAPAAQATGTSVTIQNFAFNPGSLTVKAGTTVTFTNQDSVPHTVTSDTGAFDSGTLAPGKSFTFTFQTPGSYSYHCSIHASMAHATIIAQ
jgi:plastocyanin